MPEGDTIHRSAAVLRTVLLGKPLTWFDAPRLTTPAPRLGAVIEQVEARGKHLHIAFDDGLVLHTHMRMTGSWHVYRPGERWRKSARSARVVMEVPGWTAVCFNAPVVETYRAADLRRHPNQGGLGPDLCVGGADIAQATTRIGQLVVAGTTIAETLLDQRVASGIGNVYKSEVLWTCELEPFTPVEEVHEELRFRLLDTAATMLQANLLHPERITTPHADGPLAVYGRNGKPCIRCGAPIEVRKHGELARVTYWCPGCQLRPSIRVA
jgi:endonuclease VIII